ncbi:MAG: patatin family protein [Eubacteriales bacterium]
MKKGIVLEGGAMRGMFTTGILDVMMENHIAVDGIIGVSAGAAFGCNYKSNQPGRAARYNLTYSRDPRYCSVRSLLRTGDLYGADFCYREIPETLDPFDTAAFTASPTEFYVVCTDVSTGEPVYRKCEKADREDLLWIRASASMPLVSRVVEADGRKLLDGGIADSIPLRYFQSIGYGRSVVILTQPRGYVKQKNRLLPLMRAALRSYPAVVDAMASRHERYNASLQYIREEEKRGSVLVLCPDEKLPIGRVEHDPARLRAVYEIGRSYGEAHLCAIREFLEG